MKLVVVVGDGLADEPLSELDGKTPLEKARRPTLDHMASRGILGLTRARPPVARADADVAALALLGYDPRQHRLGRGTLEAAGRGVRLRPGDLAFRCDLVTVSTRDDGTEVLRETDGGAPDPETARRLWTDLASALAPDGGGIELHGSDDWRGLLVWHAGEPRVATKPPLLAREQPLADQLPTGPGADLLRDLMRRAGTVLVHHPACDTLRMQAQSAPNALWPWGPGSALALPSLATRAGMRGAVVSAAPRIRGLGTLAGLDVADVATTPEALDAEALGRALATWDLLLVHLAPFEEATTAPDPARRQHAIERLDELSIAPLLARLRACGDEWRVLVSFTFPSGATEEPSPFLVYVAADEAKARGQQRGFHERDAREQGIFIAEAHTLMERLLRR